MIDTLEALNFGLCRGSWHDLHVQVLILSYETFRLHEERFRGDSVCDLLICDEAHRLKNDQTLTNKVAHLLTSCASKPSLNIQMPVNIKAQPSA